MSSAANAAPSPNIGSMCRGRNSSGSACIGDWEHPYLTMSFPAEAQIAREIMKFAANGTLYRGSKPVMWSVVEKTALAEAEVEYEDHVSDTVYVAFPVSERRGPSGRGRSRHSSVLRTRRSTNLAVTSVHRDLDDDALDDSRQSRDQLSQSKITYGLYRRRRRCARQTIGQSPAETIFLPTLSRTMCSRLRSVERIYVAASAMFQPTNSSCLSCSHPLAGTDAGL